MFCNPTSVGHKGNMYRIIQKERLWNVNLKRNVGIGLCGENVSMAKRAISWAMFINILIVPMIIGLVL